MNLKTLKDIEEEIYPKDCGECNWEIELPMKLKQEAIKWIKHFQKDCNSAVDKSRPCAYCRGAIDHFSNFFNIEESDLKQKIEIFEVKQ